MCQLETQALRPITQWKIPKKTLQQWFSKWGAGPLERDWSYCVGEFILITIFVRVLPWGCSLPWFPLFGINVILQLFTSRERCLGNVGEITRLYQWWWFSAGRDHILRAYPDLPGSHLWAVCVGCGRLKSWEEQGDANRLTLSRYSVVTNSVVRHTCHVMVGHDRCVCTTAVHRYLGERGGCSRKCVWIVCRLHLWFHCRLLSLLAHNGSTDCSQPTGPSNHWVGSGGH